MLQSNASDLLCAAGLNEHLEVLETRIQMKTLSTADTIQSKETSVGNSNETLPSPQNCAFKIRS